MIYLEILIISLAIVFVDDQTDWWETIKRAIWKWLYGKRAYRDFDLKPFDCSLCGTLWIGLIYLLIMKEFTVVNVGYVFLMSYLTPVFNNLMIAIRDLIIRLINKL